MSLVKAAKRQIKRYGFKGAAILTPVSSVSDPDNLLVTEADSPDISLMSYVGEFPSTRIDNILILTNDRMVLAVPDKDWDGTLTEDDKVTIDGIKYEIIRFRFVKVAGVLAFVEIQCRG